MNDYDESEIERDLERSLSDEAAVRVRGHAGSLPPTASEESRADVEAELEEAERETEEARRLAEGEDAPDPFALRRESEEAPED